MRGEDVRMMFEARATVLGLPFTHTTETADLVAQVLSSENKEFPTPSDQPSCFGIFWEGPLLDDCKGCIIQSLCLHRMVTINRSKWEVAPDLEAISKDVGISKLAVRMALDYLTGVLQQVGDPSPPNKNKAPQNSAGKIAKLKTETATPKSASSKSRPKTPPKKIPKKLNETSSPKSASRSRKESAKTAPGVVASGAVEAPTIAKPALASDASSTPMPRTKSLPRKSTPTKGNMKPPESTSTTASSKVKETKGATSTSASIQSSPMIPTPTSKSSSAKMAKTSSSDEDQRKIPWGQHTHLTRWLRERTKSPAVGNLKVGATLHRRYKGRDILVTVKQGHYLYERKQYATLYSVVKAVVGETEYPKAPSKEGERPEGKRKLVNWSATRFFAHELALVRPC